MVLEHSVGTVDDPPAAFASAQTEVDIFDTVDKLRVKTAELCENLPAHKEAGAGHHVEISLDEDTRVVLIDTTEDVLGRIPLHDQSGMLNLAGPRIKQLCPDDADRRVAVGKLYHRLQPVFTWHRVIVEKQDVVARLALGALIAGCGKAEVGIVADDVYIPLHGVQEIHRPVGRSVIDDDDLVVRLNTRLGSDGVETLFRQLCLVIDGDDDSDSRRYRIPGRDPLRRTCRPGADLDT